MTNQDTETPPEAADEPTSLAESFTAARMRPAAAVSGVGNGLQILVADTARVDDEAAPSTKQPPKQKKNKKKKKDKKSKKKGKGKR